MTILEHDEMEEGEDHHWIFAKDPNPKAIEDAMNRIFGKPKERIEHSADETLVDIIKDMREAFSNNTEEVYQNIPVGFEDIR